MARAWARRNFGSMCVILSGFRVARSLGVSGLKDFRRGLIFFGKGGGGGGG